jgi:hypothetical protein
MLSVPLHCIVRRHQLAMGKDFWQACHANKKMILLCAYGTLAGLVQRMSGGGYWMQVYSVATNVLTSFDVLLSSLCRRGMKPRSVSHS